MSCINYVLKKHIAGVIYFFITHKRVMATSSCYLQERLIILFRFHVHLAADSRSCIDTTGGEQKSKQADIPDIR